MENERFMIIIYVFLFAAGLKDFSRNMQDLSNLHKRSMIFFLLPHDSLMVCTSIMENELFLITIYLSLFGLGLKDYRMNGKDLSNLYKRSMVSYFCPVIT